MRLGNLKVYGKVDIIGHPGATSSTDNFLPAGHSTLMHIVMGHFPNMSKRKATPQSRDL